MKPRHQVSRAAVDLIKRFEGYRMKAAQLPDGRWTIGYGHTLTARQGASVSEQDAEALLLYDMIAVAHAVNEHSFTPLTQNQFDALVCFAFNIGVDNFKRSDVLRRINEGALLQAAYAMEMWRKADFEGERIVIDALVRRRSAEKTLFLTPPRNAWVAAPSPVIQPRIDHDAEAMVPIQAPTAILTSLEGDEAVAHREDPPFVIPVAPEDDRPTASEKAAAAVGARLEAILTEAPARQLVDAPRPSAQVLAFAQPAVALQQAPAAEPVEALVQAAPRAKPAETAVLLNDIRIPLAATAAAAPALFGAREGSNFQGLAEQDDVDGMAFKPLKVTFDRSEPTQLGSVGMLGVLGVVGLILFAGGIVWNLSIGSSGGFSMIKALGWTASVVGVGCFAAAAYLLLRQLGGPDDDSEH